ncbi:MAG: hypothetical protein AAGD05_19595, partial [Bacteroidota bacterium]
NGAASLQDVWCQTINITPGAMYNFSAWVTAVESSSPAILQFSINGGPIGNIFNVSSATCNWQAFSATWEAGANSTATICILNQNTSSAGNDFALDDIAFQEICEASDEITINVIDIEAIVAPPPVLDCNAVDICMSLDGSASFTSATTSLTYDWTASNGGLILNGGTTAMPVVCGAGTYTLVVRTTSIDGRTCTSEAVSVDVLENSLPPLDPQIAGLDVVCSGDLTTYSIAPDPSFTDITWFNPTNGIILGAPNNEEVTVQWTGLDVGQICVVTQNTCALSSNLVCFDVMINAPPAIPILSGDALICDFAAGFYNATVPGAGVTSYNWIVPVDAQIVQGNGTDNIIIDWTNSMGGDVCVDVGNDCGNAANCFTVTVRS